MLNLTSVTYHSPATVTRQRRGRGRGGGGGGGGGGGEEGEEGGGGGGGGEEGNATNDSAASAPKGVVVYANSPVPPRVSETEGVSVLEAPRHDDGITTEIYVHVYLAVNTSRPCL